MAKKNIKHEELEIEKQEVSKETDEKENKDKISEEENTNSEGNKEVEALKKQMSDLNDKYLRLVAEYDNYRKRTQKEKDSIYPEAVSSTVIKFLPLSDSFDRALACECKDEEFKKGVEMINNSLYQIYDSLKIEIVGTVGETFDPNFHNAVMHEQSDEHEENTVIEVFQKGYKLGDKVLRYAMVKVAN